MKRIFFLITLMLFSIIVFAQVNGSFNYGQDGHVYFYLANNSRYHVPVTVIASNAQKNQSCRDQTTIWSGNTFFFGQNYNWFWEQGETMTVIYNNGQSDKWVCPYTDPYVMNMNGGYSNNNGYNQPQTGNNGNSSQQVVKCYACHGSRRCQACNGSGTQYVYGTIRICPLCQGRAYCTQCNGKGSTANPYNKTVPGKGSGSNSTAKSSGKTGQKRQQTTTNGVTANSIEITATAIKDNEKAVFTFQKKGNNLHILKNGEQFSQEKIAKDTFLEMKNVYAVLINEEHRLYYVIDKEKCTLGISDYEPTFRISREDVKKFAILKKILYGE